MDIQVNGKQIDIGDSLRSYVADKLTTGVLKYFEHPVDAQVTFSREGHTFKCDCSVHLRTGMVLQTQSQATDIYASFDSAEDRLEKRMRRYKRRLRDHHAAKRREEPLQAAFEAPAYVIAPQSGEGESEPAGLDPVIIAEERASVPVMSVGEAVMQMDLNDAPVVVFKSGSTGAVNIVYRRADGHIGWIDATPKDAGHRGDTAQTAPAGSR